MGRKIEPDKEGVTGGWRKLYNEGQLSLNSSPNIIKMIKLRRLRWVGYVIRMA
jgi:hypothetical protein